MSKYVTGLFLSPFSFLSFLSLSSILGNVKFAKANGCVYSLSLVTYITDRNLLQNELSQRKGPINKCTDMMCGLYSYSKSSGF